MSLFKRINANREDRAGLTSKEPPKEQPKEAPKDKPKRTMTQAEFSGYAKGGYTGTDARGRRTTQSDSRVSDGAKAELPAYGFKDMTVGDVASERKRVKKEREGRKEAAGYAKGGTVSRGYGMARAGKKCKMV